MVSTAAKVVLLALGALAIGGIAAAVALSKTSGGGGAFSVQVQATPTSTTTGVPVSFSATISGGTAPYTYLWTFGDGSTATSLFASHAFASGGVFSVRLDVADSKGLTAFGTIAITVYLMVGATFQVLDSVTKLPIAGASWSLQGPLPGGATIHGTTDASGSFSAQLVQGKYTLLLNAAGYQALSEEVAVLGQGTYPVTMVPLSPPPGVVTVTALKGGITVAASGYVVDNATGAQVGAGTTPFTVNLPSGSYYAQAAYDDGTYVYAGRTSFNEPGTSSVTVNLIQQPVR